MRTALRLLAIAALAIALILATRAWRALVPPAAPVLASASATTGVRARAPVRPARGRTLAPGLVMVRGRVIDDEGKRVPQAEVRFARRSQESLADVETEADGSFEVFVPAGRLLVVATAQGYAEHSDLIRVPIDELTITLRRGAVLVGRVVRAETHSPCPGGSVVLKPELGAPLTAVADEAGEVLFPALLPGRYEPALTCSGHAAKQAAPPIEVRDAPIEVTFAVRDQFAITGIVVDETGAPAVGAEISVGVPSFDDRRSAEATSRDDGRFEVRGVQPGLHAITARAMGWWGPPHVHPDLVSVIEGAPSPEVRIVLPARHRLEGRVVDQQGRPLAGATVRIQQSERLGGTYEVGDDGRFTIEGLLPGKLPISVSLHAVRDTLLSDVLTMPVDHPLTLVVTVPPLSRIEGRVLRDAPRDEPVRIRVDSAVRGLVNMTWTDAEGRFSVVVPPDEECSLSVETRRGETAKAEHLHAGAHVEMRLRAPATLRGTVRGAPPVFKVWLTRTGREEVFFSKDGSWEMRDVPAREMEIEASAPGLVAKATITLASGEIRTVDLQLAPPPKEEPESDEP